MKAGDTFKGSDGKWYRVTGVTPGVISVTPLEEPQYEPPKGRVCHFPKPCAGGVQSCMDCEWRFDVAAYAKRLQWAWGELRRMRINCSLCGAEWTKGHDCTKPNPQQGDYPLGVAQEKIEAGEPILIDLLTHTVKKAPKPNPLFICDHAGECKESGKDCPHMERHPHMGGCDVPGSGVRCPAGAKCIPYEDDDWIVATEGGHVLEYNLSESKATEMLRNSDRRAFRWSQGKSFKWSEGIR